MDTVITTSAASAVIARSAAAKRSRATAPNATPWSIVAATVLLVGCSGLPSTIDSNEDFLASSGFHVMPAGTPAYAAAQRELPPHQFAHHTVQGVLTYYYFDPTICGCLYYGSQQNWDVYRQQMAEKRHIEAEQLLIRADTPYSGQGGI